MKKQRHLAELFGYIPYPLTKEKSLNKTRNSVTRKQKQAISVLFTSIFLMTYTTYIESAYAAQREASIQLAQEAFRIKVEQERAKLALDTGMTKKPEHFIEDDYLISLLRSAGFKGESLRTAWAVVMKESTGNPNALNNNPKSGDLSFGLFQINMIGDLGPYRLEKYGLKSNSDLYDPTINARVAFQMSKGGTDWGPWNIGPNAYDRSGKPDRSSFYKWSAKFPNQN
jgi:hypothetical protein